MKKTSTYKVYENYNKDGKKYYTIFNEEGYLVLLTRQIQQTNKYKNI